MKKTLSISLDDKHVEILDRLSKRAGSRSAALRALLEEGARAEAKREMEEAYREYFSDPENVREERALTEEMLWAAAWPPEWMEEAPKKGETRRRRASR